MKKVIKWIDCLDKSGPDKEGIYFITREDPPFVEEAAYDPEADEFIGYNDEEDWIIAWSPDPIEAYRGDGSESDEMWNVYPYEVPEEDTTYIVTCENAFGERFIQYAILLRGEFNILGSWMRPRKPSLGVVAWMYFPEPYRGRT